MEMYFRYFLQSCIGSIKFITLFINLLTTHSDLKKQLNMKTSTTTKTALPTIIVQWQNCSQIVLFVPANER